MFPVFQVGPLSLQAPGLILLIGLWLGLALSERLALRFKINLNAIYNLVFVALIAGVIGARLSYVGQHIEAFLANPSNLFSLNPGLLDPWGGMAVGFLAVLIYANRKQMPLWSTLDVLTPLLAVMLMANGLANLASGAAFGVQTDLPWGIDLWGVKRHPTQIYQSIAGGITLWLVWLHRSVSGAAQRVPGETFWFFMALSSGSWLIIEAFRSDSILLSGGLRVAQLLAWLMLAVSLWGLGKFQKRGNM